MKKTIICLITFALVLLSSNVFATDLRGSIQGYNSARDEYYPLANVQVKLMHWNGSKWQAINSVFTNSDGFYYLFKVVPGVYYIYVNKKYYRIKVNDVDYQEIGSITI